jgi:hypothetical protein
MAADSLFRFICAALEGQTHFSVHDPHTVYGNPRHTKLMVNRRVLVACSVAQFSRSLFHCHLARRSMCLLWCTLQTAQGTALEHLQLRWMAMALCLRQHRFY